VADNGSTDRTAEIVRTLDGVSLLPVPQRGKGAAVVAAAQQSNANFFCFIDADLSADPSDIPALCAALLEEGHDIVIGSRLMQKETTKRGIVRTSLSQLFNSMRKWMLGIPVHDTQCGLKLMNARGREALIACQETGWFFDIEFLARAHKNGFRIKEMPVHWDEKRFAGRESKLSLSRDGWGALAALWRIRKRLVLE